MRKPFFLKAGLLCSLFAAFFAAPGFAQAPSLAPSDAFYVTAKTEFGNEVFTVIRDGKLEEQFYFVPARPHVAVETKDNKTFPVFQLLSFQRKNAKNELKQGGILQMSVQMGISKKTEEDLLKTIKSKFPLKDSKKTYRLSQIPMKDAQISMYSLDGSMLDSAPIKEGIAPIFGNQQFPFMLNLTDLGTDVMEALCTGKGGLPVIVTYTFQGMTPPGGFKIEVDWDMCYEHFSTDTKLRANVGYAMLGANLGADFSTIREEMISNGMMKITALSNEALSDAALDAAMNPVLTLITSELFEGIKAPPSISPAAAKEIAPPEGVKEAPKSGEVANVTDVAKDAGVAAADTAADAAGAAADVASTVGSTAGAAIPYVGTIMKVLDVAADIAKNTKIDIGASFALKDAKFVKKGKFVYTYDRQAIVERKTSFGGPIGIGSFDKDIQKECITVLPDGHWEAAYYGLPSVGNAEALGYNEISLEVTLMYGDKAVPGQKVETALFRAKNGFWSDIDDSRISRFLFPLKAVYDSPEYKTDPKKFKFHTKTTVNPVAGSQVVVHSDAPIFDGNVAMVPPSELLQPVLIFGDCLSFGKEQGEIMKVQGILQADGLSFPIKLDANKPNAGFLVPKNAKSLKITNLMFMQKTGKRVMWAGSGKELKHLYPDLDISFFDQDWTGTPDSDALIGAPNP